MTQAKVFGEGNRLFSQIVSRTNIVEYLNAQDNKNGAMKRALRAQMEAESDG